MFTRIARSWRIFKNSLVVLANNKKLMIFPILSTCFLIGIVLLIFGGAATVFTFSPDTGKKLAASIKDHQVEATVPVNQKSPVHSRVTQAENEKKFQIQAVLGIVGLFVAYFISIFLATFFNVAFYSEIIHGLRGEPVFISRGFSFALSKTASIAMWALLGASVGTILKLLEERFGWLGQLVIRLIGLAWNVVTIFAVPVIICEEESLNPITNLKKSAGIIKNTWGESLVGFLGISSLNALLIFPIILLTIAMVVVGAILKSIALVIGVIIIGVVTVAFVGMLLGIAQKIYIASLYLYATEGFMNTAFSEDAMSCPFKTKK